MFHNWTNKRNCFRFFTGNRKSIIALFYFSNLKLSNLQLNKLKSRLKDDTEVTLNLSWNVLGNSNDETNFRQRLLLINRQVSRLYKAFGNNSSAKIKLSKTRLDKIGPSGEFLSRLLGPLLKSGLLLMNWDLSKSMKLLKY